jgi:hypothetical protein
VLRVQYDSSIFHLIVMKGCAALVIEVRVTDTEVFLCTPFDIVPVGDPPPPPTHTHTRTHTGARTHACATFSRYLARPGSGCSDAGIVRRCICASSSSARHQSGYCFTHPWRVNPPLARALMSPPSLRPLSLTASTSTAHCYSSLLITDCSARHSSTIPFVISVSYRH